MAIRQYLNRGGNAKRIIELHEANCDTYQIVGLFRDYGIRINATIVAGTIQGHAPMGEKALPKSAVKAAIAARKLMDDDDDRIGD